MRKPVQAGVVGVGSMGGHHARVYHELPDVDLVGVSDPDEERAREVATAYGTRALAWEALLETVDVVSVAAPTRHHRELAAAAIDHGVDVLVEKPFVPTIEAGHDLVERASAAGVTLQVGHVERFNPAVRALQEIVADNEVVAVAARRLGPPIDRGDGESVALDLMIHDVDVLLTLVQSEVEAVEAVGTHGNRYVTATVRFADGVVATLTASRLTQEKVRELSVTATECTVNVDYIDQSVLVHRQSFPEYVESGDQLSYRNESVIERPTVERGEPLKNELRSFVDAAFDGTEPVVTGEEALRALELVREIDEKAARSDHGVELR
jgi:predicted dehydrogenase